jgi:phage terminase large subunit
MHLTKKQTLALDYLQDDHTTELLYGGAAGGGKSALGCYWQLKKRLKYAGSRGLIARSELKNLRQTTLNTFFQIASIQGLLPNVHFNYNSNASSIKFFNDSEIILRELYYYPSDPYFTSLGSLEITDAFIDEGGEISDQAYNIVISRIRYNLDKYCNVCGDTHKKKILERDEDDQPKLWLCTNDHITSGLMPKLLTTCNPSKNFLYGKFYKPNKENELPDYRKFLQVLPTENKYLPKSYIENLDRLDPISRQRLKSGNWEYEDSLNQLMGYDNILNIFSNFLAPSGEKFISCDVARFGRDKTIIILWNGWRARIFPYKGKSTMEVAQLISDMMQEYNVSLSNVIVDEDGVGGGVVDKLMCRGFINNSKAIPSGKDNTNYSNLKTQCYFLLSEIVNKGELYVDEQNPMIRSEIIAELELVRSEDSTSEGKKRIMTKDEIKEILGRSPDYADALMLRCWFSIRPVLSCI